MTEYKVTGTLRAKFIKDRQQIIIQLIGWKWNEYQDSRVCYIDDQNAQAIFPEFTYDAQENRVLVAFRPLPEMEKDIRRKWKLCVQYKEEGKVIYRRLHNVRISRRIKEIRSDSQSQSFRYGYSIYTFEKEQNWYEVLPYYSINGRLGFIIYRRERMLMNSVKAKVTACRIEGSRLFLRASVKKEGFEPAAIVLHYRHEKEEEACEYRLDTTFSQLESGRYIIEAQMDLAQVALKPIYWDVILILRDKQDTAAQPVPYYVDMYNETKAFEDQFLRLRQEVAYRTENGNIFFPFVTKKGTLAFKFREVAPADSFWFRLKERLARKIYNRHKQYWDAKNIFLVYEKYSMAAQDNGYYFFRYCMEHKDMAEQDAKFYYAIDRKSPDYSKIRKYGRRVVPFLSIRHMIYLQAAKLLISTDSKAHAYAWRQKGSVLYDTVQAKKNVFLQHGVIGIKNITKLYKKNSKAGCDLFIASSEQEKEIIHKELKYKNSEIVVTGLARWDELVDKSQQSSKREVLIMPTWRGWLDSVSSEEFCKSSYFQQYQQLLTNPDILQLLEQEDLYFTFYLHPILRRYIKDFHIDNPRIRLVAFGEEPLNELIMRCRLMITDYSSASWDMLYMKKPVIFYQFDEVDFLKVHGTYMDFKKDLFGDRVLTLPELAEALKRCVMQNFAMPQCYEQKRSQAFAYTDHDNCERILQAVLKWEKGVKQTGEQ